jgi:hypothetical protein
MDEPPGPPPHSPQAPYLAQPPSGSPPWRRPPGRSLSGVLAGVALLLGLAALLVSLVALGRAGSARHNAPSAAGSAGNPPPAVVGGDTGGTSGTDTTGTGGPGAASATGSIEPTALYRVRYQGQHLRIPIVRTTSNYDYNDYIDLDEPRVGVIQDGADLWLSDTGSFSSDLPRAEVDSPNMSAQDCAQDIRTAPLTADVAASKGLNLCFLTDLGAASAEGITQKIVLLSVNSISRDDTVNVTVTAWDVPK